MAAAMRPGSRCPVPHATIAVIGDLQPGNETHDAIAPAVAHADAAADRDGSTTIEWVGTEQARELPLAALDRHDGFWIAPGSPYRSMDGALRVIRYARESDRPLLGTCAGFQHLVIELARDVLGIADAAHEENDPDSPNLFVTLLSCSLVGQQMTVSLRPGTRAGALYPAASATERYYCRFGLHPDRVADLEAGGVVVSGVDQDGEPRIIELPDHRFALATLFVPQTSSAPGAEHPVVAGFVDAVHDVRVPTIGGGGTHERGQG
jgi:CTP synthase (UTP-ammonia lyase)